MCIRGAKHKVYVTKEIMFLVLSDFYYEMSTLFMLFLDNALQTHPEEKIPDGHYTDITSLAARRFGEVHT